MFVETMILYITKKYLMELITIPSDIFFIKNIQRGVLTQINGVATI